MTLDTDDEVTTTETDHEDDALKADDDSTEQETEKVEGEGEAATESETVDEETDEVEVTIGDEPGGEDDDKRKTEAFLNLRKANREKERRIRELERENQQLKTGGEKAKPIEVGPKPTMADEDINFDPEVFEQRLDEWKQRKQAHDDRQKQVEAAERQANEAYQKKLGDYRTAAAALKVPDFEDVEAQARDVFSPVQQGLLVKYAKQPAALIYALGKSTSKAKELAAITDPIEFALTAVQLEEKHLKVIPRKTAPPPERQLRGSGAPAASAQANLTRLHEKAQRTGNYDAYLAAKRELEKKT